MQYCTNGVAVEEDMVADVSAPRSAGLDLGPDSAGLPDVIDPTKPSIARAYDYVLGGKEHFEVDRRVTRAMYAVLPEAGQLAQEVRAVLRRVVRWLVAEAGVTQLIDLGSGLPTVGNVHEVAHEIDPSVKVVYVDIDPIVLAHGRALLTEHQMTTIIQADVRRPSTVFDHPELRALIDLDRPFGVIVSSILHHLGDEQARRSAAEIRARLSLGSYAWIGNFLDDDEPRAKELQRAFLEGGLGTGRFRTWAEHGAFFEGLEMVEPGLVYGNDWKPDTTTVIDSATRTLYAGGLGRKPL